MSEDVKKNYENISKLYDMARDHEGRIMVVESTIHEIRDDQKQIKQDIVSNHKEYISDLRGFQQEIKRTINDINGIPQRNSEKIDEHDTEIHALSHNLQDVIEDVEPAIKDYEDRMDIKEKNRWEIKRLIIDVLVILIATAVIALGGWLVGHFKIIGG
jgi:chromosome segregation ATPase